MRLVALALGVLALGAPATRVLGFDYDGRRLAYFDPASLARIGTTSASYNASLCSWSYSPDRKHLAVSDCQGALRFFAFPSLRPEGRITWTDRLGRASGLAWLAPRRLVAVSTIGSDLSRLAVIDPVRRTVVRRLNLGGVSAGRALVGNTAIVLVTPSGHFGPPKLVITGPQGASRTVVVDHFSFGMVSSAAADGSLSFEARDPAFVVDPIRRHAYVIGEGLQTADIDLASGDVAYHGSVRRLAKVMSGWTRTARWLGDGLVGVAGSDSQTVGTGASAKIETTPFGLHVLDTRSWTSRSIDTVSTGLLASGTTILAYHEGWSIYDRDGRRRNDIVLAGNDWLSVAGNRGYVCDQRSAVAVIDLGSGEWTDVDRGRVCPTLLVGRASDN
jgi:hypothetical protein